MHTDDDTVAALAADHGLGGAVRLLAWADASGLSVDEIAAIRAGSEDEEPMGWGPIARELNAANPELDLPPESARSWAAGTDATTPQGRTASKPAPAG